MKQVWILNHYAQEPGGAGGTRHFSLARHLLTYGWQASVIAASVDFASGEQRLGSAEKARLDYFGNVPFLWLKTPSYKGNGGGRMLNMLIYAFRALLPASTKSLPNPDVIVGSSVHPFAALAAAFLAKRHHVPFVFEVRDLWPQTLIDLGRLREKSVMTWFLRRLELWLYHRADKIITLLPNAVDYIAPFGVAANKVIWIPNGVELDAYPPPARPVERDEFVLMYLGSHGQANGLDCLIKAMADLQGRENMPRIKLRLIGDGALKSELKSFAVSLQLRNVSFEDAVSKSRVPGLAAEADAFLICVKDLPGLYKFGISMNKLFDYLAASRPIIISSAAINNPVAEARAGFTVPPENSVSLAQAIVDLVSLSADERNCLGKNGRNFVEKNHSFEILGRRFALVLESLAN